MTRRRVENSQLVREETSRRRPEKIAGQRADQDGARKCLRFAPGRSSAYRTMGLMTPILRVLRLPRRHIDGVRTGRLTKSLSFGLRSTAAGRRPPKPRTYGSYRRGSTELGLGGRIDVSPKAPRGPQTTRARARRSTSLAKLTDQLRHVSIRICNLLSWRKAVASTSKGYTMYKATAARHFCNPSMTKPRKSIAA